MKKQRAFFVIIAILVIMGGLTLFLVKTSSPKDESATDEEILRAITRDIPSYADGGEPIIEVSSVSHPESNWYIATIKSRRPVTTDVPIRVVLASYGEKQQPHVILGPETFFTERELLRGDMPESVIQELSSK